MKSSEFVALLGAGASRSAGIPLAAELTTCALEAVRGRFFNPSGVSSEKLSLALHFVVASIQLHDARDGVPVTQAVGIERLVSAVELLKDRDELEVTPFVREWDPSVESLDTAKRPSFGSLRYREIEDAVVKLVSGNRGPQRGAIERPLKELLKDVNDAGQRVVFSALHDWLRSRVVQDVSLADDASVGYLLPLLHAAHKESGTLATLNYDLSIETCARNSGVPLNRFVDSWEATGILGESSDAVPLLKLHGSIDWISRGPDGLRIAEPGADLGGSRPALVYGQREKLRSEGPFLQLIERWRAELANCDRLIVGGYSFGDEHVNSIIRRWLIHRKDAQLVVIDPGFPRVDGFYPSNSDPRIDIWRTHGRVAVASASSIVDSPPDSPAPRVFVRRQGLMEALSGVEINGVISLFCNFGLDEVT